MKKVIGFLAIAVMLSFGTVVLTYAADPMGAPSAATAKTVKGELLKIEGEFYVVKQQNGQETRLHVNKDTALAKAFKAGDKVEAQATPEGHALSIKAAE